MGLNFLFGIILRADGKNFLGSSMRWMHKDELLIESQPTLSLSSNRMLDCVIRQDTY